MRRFFVGVLLVGIVAGTVVGQGPIRRLLFPRQAAKVERTRSVQRSFAPVQVFSDPAPVYAPPQVCYGPDCHVAAPPVIVAAPQVSETTVVSTAKPAGTLSTVTHLSADEVVRGRGFRAEFRKAIREARKQGTISIREASQLRVASCSAAFCRQVKSLAVIEMRFTGTLPDDVPVNTDGTIDIEQVTFDWSQLVPIIRAILELLVEFGIIGGGEA